MGGANDLTGDWLGFYNYDFPCPPTQFEAAIRDMDGKISGLTSETFDGPEALGTVLHATIVGRREGRRLWFTKIYDDLELLPDVIHYEGRVLGDGDEVEGTWVISGQGAGTFMMMRARREEAAEDQQVDEKIPVGR